MGKHWLAATVVCILSLGWLGDVRANGKGADKDKQIHEVSPLEFGSPVQFVSPLEFMAPAAYASPYGMIATPLYPQKKRSTYEKFVDLMPWKGSHTSFAEYLPWRDKKMKKSTVKQSGLMMPQKK